MCIYMHGAGRSLYNGSWQAVRSAWAILGVNVDIELDIARRLQRACQRITLPAPGLAYAGRLQAGSLA